MASRLTTLIRISSSPDPFEKVLENRLKQVAALQLREELPVIETEPLYSTRVTFTGGQLKFISKCVTEKRRAGGPPVTYQDLWPELFVKDLDLSTVEESIDQFLALRATLKTGGDSLQFFGKTKIRTLSEFLSKWSTHLEIREDNLLEALIMYQLPFKTCIHKDISIGTAKAVVALALCITDASWQLDKNIMLQKSQQISLLWLPPSAARVACLLVDPQSTSSIMYARAFQTYGRRLFSYYPEQQLLKAINKHRKTQDENKVEERTGG